MATWFRFACLIVIGSAVSTADDAPWTPKAQFSPHTEHGCAWSLSSRHHRRTLGDTPQWIACRQGTVIAALATLEGNASTTNEGLEHRRNLRGRADDVVTDPARYGRAGVKDVGNEADLEGRTLSTAGWGDDAFDDGTITSDGRKGSIDGGTNLFMSRGAKQSLRQGCVREATVPGTVLTTLVRNGTFGSFGVAGSSDLMDSLFVDATLSTLPDINATGAAFYTFWFRTEFDLALPLASPAPDDPLAACAGPLQAVWLVLRGVNYRVRAFANGRRLSEDLEGGGGGDIPGMFRRRRYRLHLRAGESKVRSSSFARTKQNDSA